MLQPAAIVVFLGLEDKFAVPKFTTALETHEGQRYPVLKPARTPKITPINNIMSCGGNTSVLFYI